MRGSPSIARDEGVCERQVAEALRAQWRMFERVSVKHREDGSGFEATIHLNGTLVRGAAEQRSFRPSAATTARHEAQRLDAIAACIDRVNEWLPEPAQIQDFVVFG